MIETTPVLTAEVRQRVGSKYSQRLRAKGQLPAVMYGHGQEPVSICLDAKDAVGHFAKGEKVFSLKLAGQEQTVLLRDLQFDYLGTTIVHADFSRVDLNERIHTRVRVNLVGDAVGLKTVGAIMIHPVAELDIECLVRELPDEIPVDVSSLDVGGSIYVRDVKLPSESMRMLTDGKGVVAHIVIQKEEQVVGEAVAAEGTAVAGATPAAGAAAGAPAAAGAAPKPDAKAAGKPEGKKG